MERLLCFSSERKGFLCWKANQAVGLVFSHFKFSIASLQSPVINS